MIFQASFGTIHIRGPCWNGTANCSSRYKKCIIWSEKWMILVYKPGPAGAQRRRRAKKQGWIMFLWRQQRHGQSWLCSNGESWNIRRGESWFLIEGESLPWWWSRICGRNHPDLWSNLMIFDHLWSMLIIFDRFWSIWIDFVMKSHVFWSFLIVFDRFWSFLIDFDRFWSFLIKSDQKWSFFVVEEQS